MLLPLALRNRQSFKRISQNEFRSMKNARFQELVPSMITLAVCLATVNSCTNDVRVEAPKPPDLCEVHKLPTVQKAMPETPMKGIDDNGYHPETLPYFEARKSRFPHTGFNGSSCCSFHGGEILSICSECVKAEKVWIRRHPKLSYPQYGVPDPRGGPQQDDPAPKS